MSKNRYLIISIILIATLTLYIVYNETKAKYTSTSSGESSSVRVAKFSVDVKSLLNGELKSFEDELVLTAVQDENQDKIIKDGKIAPGFLASGAFVIDTTGTEVATTYKIKVGTVEYGDYEFNNFILYKVEASYTDKNGQVVKEKMKLDTVDGITECSGEIPLDMIDIPITIEVTMIWDYIDDQENILGVEEAVLEVPIEVTVTQVD